MLEPSALARRCEFLWDTRNPSKWYRCIMAPLSADDKMILLRYVNENAMEELELSEDEEERVKLVARLRCPGTLDWRPSDEKRAQAIAAREGWPFDEADEWQTSEHEWIGRRVTRVIDGIELDARVTKWIPADGTDPALWHVLHDDGDEEDLDEAEMQAALEAFEQRTSKRKAPSSSKATSSSKAASQPKKPKVAQVAVTSAAESHPDDGVVATGRPRRKSADVAKKRMGTMGDDDDDDDNDDDDDSNDGDEEEEGAARSQRKRRVPARAPQGKGKAKGGKARPADSDEEDADDAEEYVDSDDDDGKRKRKGRGGGGGGGGSGRSGGGGGSRAQSVVELAKGEQDLSDTAGFKQGEKALTRHVIDDFVDTLGHGALDEGVESLVTDQVSAADGH